MTHANTLGPAPPGYHTATPYLVVHDAQAVITFLTQAFDAEETFRMSDPEGKIRHAEVCIGDSRIMIGESPKERAPLLGSVYLYVADVDTLYRRALDAGATSVMEPSDQYYGDRNCGVKDPAGNHWWIATRKEEVPLEELQRRAKN